MGAFTSSLAQAWPPFILVGGLLLIGHVAAADGLFEMIGSKLASLPGSGRVLYLATMASVATITVILNLDTAIVFLTPIALDAARRRKCDERAFLYGAIFMSNSASLLLPGSNLTNVLVVSALHLTGARYALAMVPSWSVAIVTTGAIIAIWQWKALGVRESPDVDAVRFRIGIGSYAVITSTVLVLVLTQPALPVFGAALVFLGLQSKKTTHHSLRSVLRAVNLELLVSLFAVAVGAGVVARVWNGPRDLMRTLGGFPTALVSGASTNLINNLPATLLFSSERPLHPHALLIGLDLGPNLTVLGAMSSLLWLRVARAHDARPSAGLFFRIGMILTPISLLTAVLVDATVHLGHL